MKVKKQGFTPNVMKAMVLDKTADIYKSLSISEMKVVNIGSNDKGSSTQKLISETMATYTALKDWSKKRYVYF